MAQLEKKIKAAKKPDGRFQGVLGVSPGPRVGPDPGRSREIISPDMPVAVAARLGSPAGIELSR
jgi:hypothetical protein